MELVSPFKVGNEAAVELKGEDHSVGSHQIDYRLAVHFSNRTLKKKRSFHVVYKIVVLLILNLLNF